MVSRDFSSCSPQSQRCEPKMSPVMHSECGSVFLAVGLFASSFTKSQVVAAVATFALLIFFFAIAFMDSLVTQETIKNALGYMNLLDHMQEFGKGVVDSRRLIYYVTTSVLFLFLTARSLEAKKWR